MKLRDLREDQPLSLSDAAEFLGKLTGQKPHVSTLWRWCLKGCKGVRLESICIGGKRFVTATAIERFIDASSEARTGQQSTQPSALAAPPTPGKGMLTHVMRHNDRRRQEIEAARRRLDEITGAVKPSAPATRSA